MLKALFKSQRGFTLIELLAVMAIVATLAGIVATQVSGSGQTSRDVQTKQDASTVESAVADFFSDQEGAEILISSSATVLDEESISIATSSQWPEIPITFAYAQVFQPTRSQIAAISFFSEEGTPSVLSVRGLFENYNAVDFFALEDGGYLTALPDGVSNTTKDLSTYLRLLKKQTASSSGRAVSSRVVEVFKLVTIQQVENFDLDVLAYQRIVGTTITAVSGKPAGIPQNAVTGEITPVDITLGGIDPEEDPLSFTVLAGPENGLLTGAGPNLTYLPDAGFFGTDSFFFKVSDGTSDSEPAQVFIKVVGTGASEETPPSFIDVSPSNKIDDLLDAEMLAAPAIPFQVIVVTTNVLSPSELLTLGAAIDPVALTVDFELPGAPAIVVTLQPPQVRLLAEQSLVVRIDRNDPLGGGK